MVLSKSSFFVIALSASHVVRTIATNFMVIQPDDMAFFNDWEPPAPLPPWTNYPVDDYPGSSDLPNINKLRDEGLEMTQAYTASPKCGTSRYSTITGRYASRSSTGRSNALGETGPSDASILNTKLSDVESVDDGSDCSVSNLAQVFSKNNYVTGMVGKWHLSYSSQLGTVDAVKEEIESCGFQDVEAMYPENINTNTGWWSGDYSHNMEYVAYKAVEFIEANENNDWFLYVNPTAPHAPNVEAAMAMDCLITPDGNFTDTEPHGWSVIGMTAEFDNDCAAYRADVAARAESTSNADLGSVWVDDLVGSIFKSLQRTGQLEDTMIIFQVDHGKAEKDKIWEGGLRIPQFIHYPNGVGTDHRVFEGMVSTIDIAPTLLDFAGINESSPGWYEMDGTSWKTAIDDDAAGEDWKANRCLFFESSRNRAVRCGCEKYILLDDTSDELATASAYGWWSDNEVLVSLCDSDENYIDADESTEVESPEITNVISLDQSRADELATLLQCHLNKTDADIAPVYEECSISSTEVTTPQYAIYSPLDGDVYSADYVVIEATVVDDNLRAVNFNVRYPDGSTLGFTNGRGNLVSSSGDYSTWDFTLDTSVQKGMYEYKFKMKDTDGNDVIAPDNGWIEFWVFE